jgi:hypothetical protein
MRVPLPTLRNFARDGEMIITRIEAKEIKEKG